MNIAIKYLEERKSLKIAMRNSLHKAVRKKRHILEINVLKRWINDETKAISSIRKAIKLLMKIQKTTSIKNSK